MRPALALLALGLSLLAAPLEAAEGKPDDATAIRALLGKQFDRPEAKLAVEPVVVRGRHAVAGWIQADRGGRALLRRDHGRWKLVACAGDAFLEAGELEKAGVGRGDARALAKSVKAAETKLPAEHRRKLALFEGILQMNADGSHPPSPAAHKH